MKRVSARGIIITDKGLAVIFRRKKVGDTVREYYAIPGGGVEEGESIEEALKRELWEELAIKVNIKGFAFSIENEYRIEYYYNCEYISGDFRLNGEELDRITDDNYYEPTFVDINNIDKYDIVPEVKDYLKGGYK